MSNVAPSRLFWGRPPHKLATAGLRVYESRYAPGDRLRRHAHEKAHFCYVAEGGYAESLVDGLHERQPGALVYYPPHTAHAEQHYAPGRHLLVELEPDWWECSTGSGGPKFATVLSGGRLPQTAAGRLAVLNANDPLSGLVVESLVLEWGALLTGPARKRCPASERWLNAVGDLLENRFREPLTLSEIAAHAGVHPAHLVKAFRRRFGCGIGAHMRRLRLAEAIRRLRDSEEPLASVAVHAGFADQSHLTRVMKTHTGTTPGALRRTCRTGNVGRTIQSLMTE